MDEENTDAFKASRAVFDLCRGDEYEKASRIMELCGSCRRCGNCCRDLPCRIQESEILKISNLLDIEPDKFRDEYVVENKEVLYLETPCPFLREDNTCEVYEARPEICRWHPVKVVIPFTYQIRTSERCDLGTEIGEKFDVFAGSGWEQESDISDEVFETISEFSEDLGLNYFSEKESFILLSASAMEDFLEWLEGTEE
ncbi:MAG: YkgJ family cysteine cluster protein [Candidatus Hadarchaeota archaeon]